MKEELKSEILEDFNRAKVALASAKRNFEEGDILTASNRIFVACENVIYAHLKLKFGNTTFSRKRIILKLGEIDPILKEVYEGSYDMRVQADYGRRSRIITISKKNVEEIVKKVEKIMSDTEIELKNAKVL